MFGVQQIPKYVAINDIMDHTRFAASYNSRAGRDKTKKQTNG